MELTRLSLDKLTKLKTEGLLALPLEYMASIMGQ